MSQKEERERRAESRGTSPTRDPSRSRRTNSRSKTSGGRRAAGSERRAANDKRRAAGNGPAAGGERAAAGGDLRPPCHTFRDRESRIQTPVTRVTPAPFKVLLKIDPVTPVRVGRERGESEGV